ncbi:hypothetical protein GCM10022407_23110 [Hymenobacter antarcticus]|uniref:5'-Nucleotidase C-terminal domain-containing protein n=2 Tax=Hymenobacter antarcticus TaxID=486270 RepID=A0ABP7Q6D6_9BACT
MTLTGAQLTALLEQSATNLNPGDDLKRVGGLIQSSGLDWTADLGRQAGQRVSAVQVNGQPLAATRAYRVVTHNVMLSGIHRYTTFAQGQEIKKLNKGVTDVVEAGLRRRGKVAPPVPARVQIRPAKK